MIINKSYESNFIKYFSKSLSLESGLNYDFKKSFNDADDGYLVLNNIEIPVQLVQATDPILKQKISEEIKKKKSSSYYLLDAYKYCKLAIKSKSNKNYSDSNKLLLLIHSAECSTFLEEEDLADLKSMPEVLVFKAVYLFYASDKPKIINIKSL